MSRGLRHTLLFAAALASLGVARPPGLSDVTEVRHWSYGAYTRVVVELTGSVKPDVRRLAADPKAGRPERLYVDLPGAWVGARYRDPIRVGDGLLFSVRVGQNTLGTTRVVLDLKRYQRHRLLVLRAPDRVVLDVYAPPSRAEQRAPVEMRAVRTVVIDPGHGGRDPGAIGIGGLREKQVTLKLALRLRERLRALGFETILTRDKDRTLSLEERTAIAEGSGGDVFLSLHANAARRRGANGIETYYLNPSHRRHTLTVAARENGVSRKQVDDLQRTLATLRVGEVSQHGSRLARSVQTRVVRAARTRYRKVEDLGVKQGPFYVLFLSSMPSILVETGFLTNPTEVKRLRSDAYLDLLAEAIALGVADYRDQMAVRFAEGQP